MIRSDKPRAVIYCRVSSAAQMRKGDGLASQETRCRDYAKHKGYEIAEVFRDEGTSGGMIDRPGMLALLAFLKKHRRTTTHIVIIDDISRLARGLEAHIRLRAEIGAAGGKLESPAIEFGEDSDSMLVENLLASVSQHQRQKNAEQTKARMRARVANGYWAFNPPVGYRFARVSGHSGRVLVPDEPRASLVRDALEGFASGRFDSQTEIKRFLEAAPEFPKDRRGEVHLQRITNMLGKVIYTGYLSLPEWGIHLQPARHEPLISFETYKRNQERLNGEARAPARADICADFPLRGIVHCACCDQAMTAAWSRGKGGRYAYYYCYNKACPENRKSIAKSTLETRFEALLAALQPSRGLFFVVCDMLKDHWHSREHMAKADVQALKREITTIEGKVEQLLERVIEAEGPSLVAAYENQIRKLEERKALLSEQITARRQPRKAFEDTFRTALEFLANPCNLWTFGDLTDRRKAAKLAFDGRLSYCRKEGFSNPKTTLPFKVLEDFRLGKYEMARHS